MRRVLFFLLLVFPAFSLPAIARETSGSRQEKPFWRQQREKMVDFQLRRRGIQDEKVLEAMQSVKRHLFVPGSLRRYAYADRPLPIGRDQTISQPYIVAYMTEALDLSPEDRVLEIGTGSGYQAAVLAEIVSQVYTIEIIPELADMARQKLDALGYDNVKVKTGDGYQGWPEHAPFDAIIVTAAPPFIPDALIEQLSEENGNMIVPVGTASQELILITKTKQGVQKKKLLPVRFVPMVEGKSP